MDSNKNTITDIFINTCKWRKNAIITSIFHPEYACQIFTMSTDWRWCSL